MPFIGSLIILILALIIGFSAAHLSKKPDTPIEEAAEAVIKMTSGLDIEFSPDDKDLQNHKSD